MPAGPAPCISIHSQIATSDPVRRLRILTPLPSLQEPGIEASRLVDLEACCRAVALLQGTAADDLDGPDQDASGQNVHVDAELGSNPGFFVGFDPVAPGVDVNPFPDVGSLGPDLDALVPQEDQLSPGLSDAEGSHDPEPFQSLRGSNPRRCQSLRHPLPRSPLELPPGRHSHQTRSSPRSSSSRRFRAESADRSGSRR